MNTPVKLGGYALGLVAAGAAAAGVGHAVGPIGPVGSEAQHGAVHVDSDPVAVEEIPGGLMVSQDGYTLALAEDSLPAGKATPVSFRVQDREGMPVTGYAESHGKEMHFIAVRRDMTGFQHVHPRLADDGTWSTALDLTPGDWRVFADFVPSAHGEALTLGADLAVPGGYHPRPLPEPAAIAHVDEYTVSLDGQLQAGKESELTLSVSRDGAPVTDLQPYLAAYGHLVVLRKGDLAYLHVHPAGEPGDGATEPGPYVTFYATTPSVGDYRLFLDFRHNGVVRTAEFTVRAEGDGADSGGHGKNGHGHGH